VPAPTSPLWHYGIAVLAKKGITPIVGQEAWDIMIEMGRDSVGHLDVFESDAIAEKWYGSYRTPKVLGEAADRHQLWEAVRFMTANSISPEKVDLISQEVGPTPGVTGMIPKLTSRVDLSWLSTETGQANCLIKVEPEEFPLMLTLEAECYRIHQAAGCITPRYWLKNTVKGTPLLAVELFDREPNGERRQFESLFSLLRMVTNGRIVEYWSATKPKTLDETIPNLETVAAAFNDSDIGIAPNQGPELVKRVALALMTGNSDLHLANLSFLGGRKEATLSPIYDPAPMGAYSQHSMVAALNFGKLQLSRHRTIFPEMWEKLIEFAKVFGIRRNKAVEILQQCHDATAGYLDFLTDYKVKELPSFLETNRGHLERTIGLAPTTAN
jgi:serine/threonine-protein kinase HipA